MLTSTYNLCLLVTNSNADTFGIVSIQTNNTIMLRTTKFLLLKEKKLKKAQFRSKLKTVLTPNVQLEFNSCTLTMNANKVTLNLRQKGQGGKIRLVDIKAPNCAQ
jgi:hypothetical protein